MDTAGQALPSWISPNVPDILGFLPVPDVQSIYDHGPTEAASPPNCEIQFCHQQCTPHSLVSPMSHLITSDHQTINSIVLGKAPPVKLYPLYSSLQNLFRQNKYVFLIVQYFPVDYTFCAWGYIGWAISTLALSSKPDSYSKVGFPSLF